MDVTIRALGPWPQAETKPRKAPQFSATWGDTMDLIQRELRFLGAKRVVIEAGFRERDIRLDGWPRADARTPEFPGVILSFESKFGPLRYLTDAFTNGSVFVSGRQARARGSDKAFTMEVLGWHANLRAIALSLEALRSVDRYGVSRRGEQYTGWNALPPGMPMGRAMTVEEALETLAAEAVDAGYTAEDLAVELDPESDQTWITTAYRIAVKRLHPDTGTAVDLDAFRRVQQAHEVIEAETKRLRGG